MPAPTDHDAERCRIVFAVWAAIAEVGIAATTLRKVAEAGETSIGRIQHYFSSRDELLQFSCSAMVQSAANAQPETADPHEALLHLLTHNLNDTAAYRGGARVWAAYIAQAAVDEKIGQIVVAAQTGLEHEIARLLTAVNANPAAARRLVALSDGLAQRTLTGALTAEEATTEILNAVNEANHETLPSRATASSR